MLKILLAGFGALVFAVIVFLGNIQSYRQAQQKTYLTEKINHLISSRARLVLEQLHPEYLNEANRPQNQQRFEELQQGLSALGKPIEISEPVFSYRGATRPFKTEKQSDIYIVRVKFGKADALFRVGLVEQLPKSAEKPVYIDRLFISSEDMVDDQGRQMKFSLYVQCSEDKKIIKKCSKAEATNVKKG